MKGGIPAAIFESAVESGTWLNLHTVRRKARHQQDTSAVALPKRSGLPRDRQNTDGPQQLPAATAAESRRGPRKITDFHHLTLLQTLKFPQFSSRKCPIGRLSVVPIPFACHYASPSGFASVVPTLFCQLLPLPAVPPHEASTVYHDVS